MGKVAIGADNAPVFCNMFMSAQKKKKADSVLDGIVNQWMLCEARRKDEKRGGARMGPEERSLHGVMISPRLYLY